MAMKANTNTNTNTDTDINSVSSNTSVAGVKKIIDNRMTWLLFGLCWLIYFSSYIGRLNYSSAMPDMINAGRFHLTQAGSVNTVFFICYAAGQLINGLLSDRLNLGNMVLTGIIISALANLLMPFFSSGTGYILTLICWGVNGYSLSMLWPAIVRVFSDMLDEGSMIKCCVHITSSTVAGNFFAYLLSALIIKILNWEAVFYCASGLLLIVAAVWRFAFVRIEHFRNEYGVMEIVREKTSEYSSKKGFLGILISSGAIIFLIPVIVHGALKDGITAWIPTMLSQTFSVSSTTAVLFSSVLPVINLSGAYAANYMFRKKIKNESMCAGFFFLTAIVGLGGVILFGKVSILLSVVFLSVITSSMLAVNTLLISLVPLRFRLIGKPATVSGFFNSAAYLGSAGTSVGIGWLAGGLGWNAVIICFFVLAVSACIACLAGGKIKLPG